MNDLRVVRKQLILVGQFTSVAANARTYAASVDALSGQLTSFFRPTVADPHVGTTLVIKMDVSPDATRLVMLGNFATING